jgi:sec-independent protein translocase protein TatA
MNWLQPWHLLVLLLIVVVLFGAKRLPDAARSVGKSMKIFKAETKGLRSDEHPEAHTEGPNAQDMETRRLTAPAPTNNEQRIADLQHQLDALKAQQSTAPDQSKNAG